MVPGQDALTIAGLARLGGVGVETIRYYQRRGLLRTPERRPAPHERGIRRYDGRDVGTLRFIRSAQAAGFTLAEIAELLLLDARDDRPRARQLAAERVEVLTVKIAELTAARDALARLARDCAASGPGPCPILAAFDGHERG